MSLLEIKNLVVEFQTASGPFRAVDGVSFSVEAGEVFALLGPNGAGKTTTVEILEGHRRRTSGSVDVLGFDPQTGGRDYRERVGIVLQEAGFEEDFTVRELVHLYRGMYPRQLDTDELIEHVGLGDKRHARIKTLSGGQRRRLDLALGLVGDPELIFLDEPTTGFDPAARRRAWELVGSLRDMGKTVLLTTHYMDEAEHLADRVAVVVAGRVIALGTPDEIGGEDRHRSEVAFGLADGTPAWDVPDVGAPLLATGHGWHFRTTDPAGALLRLTSWADARGIALTNLSVTRPSLEDVYLDLIAGAGASYDELAVP